jgi:hypothetical protein
LFSVVQVSTGLTEDVRLYPGAYKSPTRNRASSFNRAMPGLRHDMQLFLHIAVDFGDRSAV